MRARGAGLTQIADQHMGRLIRQGQVERLPRLGLRDMQRAPTPVDVVERQPGQFPTAQPLGGRQIQQRKVTSSERFGGINGSEEGLHLWPGKRPRQQLPAIHSRPIDLQMERS